MSIERTYYCEGPDCGEGEGEDRQPCNVTTASPPPYLPTPFIETREVCDGVAYRRHFCGWACLMKYAAAQPIPTIIPWDDALGASD